MPNLSNPTTRLSDDLLGRGDTTVHSRSASTDGRER